MTMTANVRRIYTILFSIFYTILPLLTAQAETLSALEAQAERQFAAGDFSGAHETYRLYASQLQADGMNPLNPDLLYNQAIVSYRAGHPGLAIGYLRQLDILKPSTETKSMLAELRMLIEHGIYRQAPGTLFVRGEPSSFTVWRHTHHFSEAGINITLIFLWTLWLVSLYAIYRYWKRRKIVFRLTLLSIFLFATAAIQGYFVIERHLTSSMTFAVLTDTETLSRSPGGQADFHDESFAAGTTVRVLTRSNDWVHIERADGKTAWSSEQSLYILRGNVFDNAEPPN